VTPERWARVRDIFDAALKRSALDRGAFLDDACAGDPELRREVGSLLAAHDGAADFIESPAYEVTAHLFADVEERPLSGTALGPYIIRHEIGRGGMGVVYLADDTRLSRRVALKALGPGMRSDAAHRDRLRHEARAAAALSHPGIATVYALEEIDDELYLASEYVPGPTLRALIEQGPLRLAEVVDVATQVARALAAAHAQGIVHRDVKPENVVRSAAGVIKILDFGVARIESFSGPRLTGAGAMVGTPAYMAPEQIHRDAVDFRTDQFALGLLVYEMASGTNPFEADSATATIARILEVNPPPLSQACSTGSAGLDRIVATCLRKDPVERYPSTQTLVGALERLQRQLSPEELAQDTEALPLAGMSISPSTDGRATPWWEIHQLVTSVVYGVMVYPAWRARVWLPTPWNGVFFFAVVAAAVVTAVVRLHLVFTSRAYPAELPTQRARARPWTMASDILFSVSLLLTAIATRDSHSEVASLLFSVAIAAGISTFMIEPTTTAAVFRDSEKPRG
jgi:serine/threonine protein kinase